MSRQKTIASKVCIEGIGLHTGSFSKIELLPAPPNTGIFFLRKDIEKEPAIKVDFKNLLNPNGFLRRTSIEKEGVCIHTIEHLMSALSILCIDNLQINIWGEEIPGLDGSSKIFVDKIKEAGIVEQDYDREYLVVKEPIWVEDNFSKLIALPNSFFKISYLLKYDNPLIGLEYLEVEPEKFDSCRDIFLARTFCTKDEADSLLKLGLGKGANYNNTLVVSEKEVINNNLRVPDEFVKHKVLDLIGDLYVIGPIKAHIIAIKSGHNLNYRLLQRLYRSKKYTLSMKPKINIQDKAEIDIEEIMDILPHRYPFLLIDRVIYLEKGKKAVGIKNVSFNENFFQGHFPDKPIMPGVLILEAMAQVGGVLVLTFSDQKIKYAYFMSINNAKFRKTVVPGDQLFIEVSVIKIKSKIALLHGEAFVGENLVAEADLMFTIKD